MFWENSNIAWQAVPESASGDQKGRQWLYLFITFIIFSKQLKTMLFGLSS